MLRFRLAPETGLFFPLAAGAGRGGRSVAVNAPGCGPGDHGFKSRRPPQHSFCFRPLRLTLTPMAVSAVDCQRCGAQVLAGAAFCQNCGATLDVTRAQTDRMPWTPADVLKAIGIVVAVLIGTSIPASISALVIAGNEDIEKDSLALTVALAASVFLEIGLLAAAIYFSIRKYRLPWSALGLRWPQQGGVWTTAGLVFGLLIAGLVVSFAYFGALAV